MTTSFDIDHLPGRTITHAGSEYLFFSGTAYLGLQQNPAFQQLLVEGTNRYGTSFGSSRNGNLRLAIYEAAEAELARRISGPGTSALTVSSGMMAGQVVVQAFRAQEATFIYAPCAHPALWNVPAPALPAGSFADWTQQLPEQLRAVTSPAPIVVLTNAIDALHSNHYSFDWVNDLPDDRPITLVVDDSHGLGLLNGGRGIWPQLPTKENVELLVTGSLAKAMGLPGGAVFGNPDSLDRLRKTAFFGGSSPIPPAYLDAFLKAEPLYTEAFDKLQQNLTLAEKLLGVTALFNHAKGYPVFFTEQDKLYPYLLERNIVLYSFAYPTVHDPANTRIVISAFHELADIQQLAYRIYDYMF
ncbi:aminotransferase class I/II-fold pyridoxal phosphate-dependent enzyme [Spirosoma sp. KUDC1026]|uniref:aminotransferase class I/II-fold pyridoxal phosphate-dependent enzyme n=1 Tax=Spirosoma sp. KUDC1026 TaxID=2745947 RepID=UPI00159B8F52|nr:aminotransferase class I/II-fold pyridoxal phosphate-dependent enzyme [Spirosoma sp. KUDC1026]QKZ15422.1 pyridoxal phosphate-dependent aminotransferase family protein [Spirosoma sp. KUDC1026]